MSYATDVKNELAHVRLKKDCCAKAELAGFMKGAGSVRILGAGQLGVAFYTTTPAIARRYKALLDFLYKERLDLKIFEQATIRHKHSYLLQVRSAEVSKQILLETETMIYKNGELIPNEKMVNFGKRMCCRGSFLRGLFLAVGNVASPKTGYRLEFFLDSERYAKALVRFINTTAALRAKLMFFRESQVVYIQNADGVKDLLLLMGAYKHMMELENIRIVSEARGRANRLENCDGANMDRILKSSLEISELLRKKLEKCPDFIDRLDKELAIVLKLRLDNEEASVKELSELLDSILDKKIDKSWVQYRLQKLRKELQ